MGFGGGGGGGVADGVGTILKYNGAFQSELDVDGTPLNVNDFQGTTVFLPGTGRTAALTITGEVDPLLTSQLGDKNATGGGVAKLRSSDGAVLDGAGNPVTTGSSTPDATSTVKGKIQLAGDLAGGAAAPTVPGLALKRNTADQIDWNTEIANKPGSLTSPRIADRLSVATITNTTTESSLADLTLPGGTGLAGDEYTLSTSGTLANAGGGTVRFQVYMGGVVFNTTAITVASSAQPRLLRMRARMVLLSDGTQAWEYEQAVGTGVSGGFQQPLFSALTGNSDGVISPGLDLTADIHMKITVIFGSAQTGNTVVSNYATLNRTRP